VRPSIEPRAPSFSYASSSKAEETPEPYPYSGVSAMSPLPDEVDLLVVQLAASLEPPQYAAFIDAARTALADIPCLGPGSAYRILVPLQRRFFDPPEDRVAYGPQHYRRPTKLSSLPPVGIEDARGTARRLAMWARR